MKNTIRVVFLTSLVSLVACASTLARANFEGMDFRGNNPGKSTYAPAYCAAEHNIGQLQLTVWNAGIFGTGFRAGSPIDCFTGQGVTGCAYPKGSNSTYLFAGAFWIGAVVGRDTLVSVGADGWSSVREFFPDESPFGDMIYRSITDPDAPEAEDAISEQDYIGVYTDTVTDGVGNDYFGRPHIPMYIEVTQSSYAWSYSYAEDFVLFDYRIRNIGREELADVYMGIYVDADVWNGGDDNAGAQDDICGFLQTFPDTCGTCPYYDTSFVAYIADADADWSAGGADQSPVPHTTAARIVRTPADSLDVSFNWWISDTPALDYGPRHAENLRDFRTGGLGTPEGDVNKYHVLSNGEFDYDQIFAADIPQNDTLWLKINSSLATRSAVGDDTRYLLSFGPFNILPGQTLPISFAYMAGADLHPASLPDNWSNHLDLVYEPDVYYSNLDFSDLARNSKWASYVYDNPGVDTDGDGYYGTFLTCASDSAVESIDTMTEVSAECPEPPCFDTNWTSTAIETCWTKGDDVPDFRGASPPPAPDFWVHPDENEIRIRFNGLRSETTIDMFSRLIDFEGYRVYLGRDTRLTSLAMVASYDRKNFNKWTLTDFNRRTWELLDVPFTIEELMALYAFGDENWDPNDYSSQSPYVHPLNSDSVFYFEPQDYNASRLGIDTPIRKIYPDQEYPSTLVPDSAEADELTEDGYLKYFEYELVLDNLSASTEWFINVTAFDFGSPQSGLASLESSPTVAIDSVYAQKTWSNVDESGDGVYIYPNPYRIDGEYLDWGYEGRNPNFRKPEDRTRVLHFANLPPECTIRIFTLDGDLVREIDHDFDESDPQATHDEWNLITRNTQLVVSGLYYWTVETPDGDTQIGKLVVIM